MLSDGTSVLINKYASVRVQAGAIKVIDAVLLTHAHRDASGGIAQLAHWCAEFGGEPLPVYAHADTIAAVRRRHARLAHVRPTAIRPARRACTSMYTLSARAAELARSAV